LLLVGTFVFSLTWVSSDYTTTPVSVAENHGVILSFRDVCLAAQEPPPMEGAAEGV